MVYFRSGDAIKYIPGSLGLEDRTYIGDLFMPRRRRTSSEGIAGRIKMRFLRDKRSNETNARCHVELFVSLLFSICVYPSFIRSYPIDPFVSYFFNDSSIPFLRLYSREIHMLSSYVGRFWTMPRVHRTLLRPLDKWWLQFPLRTCRISLCDTETNRLSDVKCIFTDSISIKYITIWKSQGWESYF